MRVGKRTAAITGAAFLAVAALGGVAFATGNAPFGDDLQGPGSISVDERTLPEDDVAERAALAALATVDEAAAGTAAVASAGGGQVLRAGLEEEDGYVVWEVVVRAGDGTVSEVFIDAGDATVLGSDREDDSFEDGEALRAVGTVRVDEQTRRQTRAAEQEALGALATVDQAEAATAATQSLGGGEVVRAELADEDGSVVWEVVVRADDGTWREVTVDAGDASVLGVDLENEDD